jgi:hypothetical protein
MLCHVASASEPNKRDLPPCTDDGSVGVKDDGSRGM